MENKLTQIPINIWDDFYEDGQIPINEIQETYAYVEEYELLSNEEHKLILEILFNYIKENLTGINIDLIYHDTQNDYDEKTVKRCIESYGEKFFYKRYEITFKNITHKRLEKLVKELNKTNLIFNNLPFKIYSES